MLFTPSFIVYPLIYCLFPYLLIRILPRIVKWHIMRHIKLNCHPRYRNPQNFFLIIEIGNLPIVFLIVEILKFFSSLSKSSNFFPHCRNPQIFLKLEILQLSSSSLKSSNFFPRCRNFRVGVTIALVLVFMRVLQLVIKNQILYFDIGARIARSRRYSFLIVILLIWLRFASAFFSGVGSHTNLYFSLVCPFAFPLPSPLPSTPPPFCLFDPTFLSLFPLACMLIPF